MTRRTAALVVLVALLIGAATIAGAAATLGVTSRTIDSFTADLPASTTTTAGGDVVAPPRTALEMFDTNANGKVDQVKVTFNETLAGYTAGNAPWTLANVPSSGGALSSVAVTGSVATLTLNEGAGAANTAVGSFTVALATNANGIRDAAGNQSSFAATVPTDKAAPVRMLMEMFDASPATPNGKVDRVAVTFSETLAGYTAGNAPWTLANVPSTGTLAGVTATGAAATLTLNEGAGAPNTAVGSFTVALATNANGIRDAAGNQSSFAATAPTDKAGPVPIQLSISNGSGNQNDVGEPDQGDTIQVRFSETLNQQSICATNNSPAWTDNGAIGGNGVVVVTITDGGTSADTLTVTASICTGGLKFGSISLGSTGYVTSPATTRTFSGNGSNQSSIQWTSTPNAELLLTLGTPSGAVGTIGSVTATYTPNAGVTDNVLPANSISGTTSSTAVQF